MAYFAVTLERGPGWDPSRPRREQDEWDAHADFMDALADDGFIVLGGPIGGGELVLHAVQADSVLEIRARLSEDPWAPMDMLRIASIEPWEVLLRAPPTPDRT